MEKIRKIKLEVEDLEVASISMERDDDAPRGTVIANSTIFGCGQTVVVPRTCNLDVCG